MTIQEYNDIYKNSITKSMQIESSGGVTITNTNICLEEMSLEESLCSDGNLTIGACESACFKIRIADMNHNFEGELLTVNQIIPIDQNTDETIPYGVFKVISDKATNDRKWRDLTCYDAMYDILNADVSEWFNSLTFPMTVKNLRDSFFTYLGVTQVTTTLVNDNFQTQGGFSVSGVLSGKDIITAICEINGVFGHISREGQFEYISLPSADSLTLDWYMDGTGAYEDYLVQKITGIVARSSESDVGTSVGTDTNVYVIQDNPLIYGTEGTSILITALTNVLNNVNDIMYRPFNVSTYGNPMLPLGTNLTIETRNQTINSFVMSRLLTGIQSLKDSYSAVGDKNRPSEVNSLRSEINRTKGKIHELVVTTDELRSTISSIEEIAEEASEDASDAKQTAEGVATDLSTNYFTKSETTSEISQSATSILSTVSQTYTPKASAINTDTLHYLATSQSSGVTTSTPGWTTTIQSVTSTDKYLWTYHTYTYADDHTSDTTPIITGVYGDQGQQGGAGPQGPQGPTGTGISTVTPLYYAGTSTKPSKPTSVVTSTSTSGGQWTKAIPSLSTTYPNLYTCDQVYYTNGTYSWSDVVSDINSTTSYSEINQLKDKIVLKVDNSGKIVQVALSANASTGSEFKVKADNIDFIANGEMNLTANSLGINASNFQLDKTTGNITCNGGTIGGWTIDSTKLSKSWDDGTYSGSMEINSADTTITAIRDGRSKMEYRGDRVLLTSNYNNDGTYYNVLELGFMSGSIWTGSRDTGYLELFDTTNGSIDKRIDIDAATSQINVYSNSSTSSTVSSSGFYSTGFTGDRVACINASKKIVSSDVTPTELGYLSGATSNIQGQIDGLGAKSVSGNPVVITDAEAMNANSVVATITPAQIGIGTPSPSNVKPFVPYTSVNVIEEIVPLDFNTPDTIPSGFSYSYNNNIMTLLANGTFQNITFFGDFVGNATRKISFSIIVTSNKASVAITSEDYSTVYYNSGDFKYGTYNRDVTFTAPQGKFALLIFGSRGNRPFTPVYVQNMVISNNDQGKQYTIQLGDTYYGANVDITDGNNETIYGDVDISTLNWAYTSSGYFYVYFASAKVGGFLACEALQATTSANVKDHSVENSIAKDTNGNLIAYYTASTDPTTFKTAMSGVKLVFERVSSISFNTIPTQIELLENNNTIASNALSLDITYQANSVTGDTASILDKRLTKLENGIIPSTNEKVVGTWVDGKPIYEITMLPTSGTASANTWVNIGVVGLGINTVDKVLKCYGVSSNGSEYYSVPNYRTILDYVKTEDKMYFYSSGSTYPYPYFVTMQYTKA